MAAVIWLQYPKRARKHIRAVIGVLLSLTCALAVYAEDNGPRRLQELLAGEVWYLYHQKDYFSALSQLQKARDSGLPSPQSADMEILMARLRLAYGLPDQAGAALRSMRDEDLAEGAANRAWYELARSRYHKGQPAAAQQALDSVRGEVPEDIAGDLQLLRAHVLSALARYADAAQVLAEWRGPAELAPYAQYNRGIALMRAGDQTAAIAVLQLVAEMPAGQEDMLALRDKSNLTLGYIFLQLEELEQARERLDKVRLQGPFSNRALLAAGMVAQMQGRGEEALVPWMVLRERMLADPAVQESLLAVPYVQRQLTSSKAAALHYEQAVASLSRELRQLNETMRSVRQQATVNRLLTQQAKSNPASRYLGDLMASRVFQETSRGHNDLRSMLDNVDQGLESVDQLQKALQPPARATKRPAAKTPALSSVPPPAVASLDELARAPLPERSSAKPAVDEGVVAWQGAQPTGPSSRGIPLLPEAELPAEKSVTALPGSGAAGLPAGAEDIGLPPAPEDIGLPLASGALGLPPAPQDIGLPPGGSWRDLQRDDDESPYTEVLARRNEEAATSRRLLRRILRPGREQGLAADGMPMDKALGELAAALGHTTERMAELVRKLRATGVRDKLLRDRIAALRERILQLRTRIDAALARYEDYARTLALAELAQRQGQLESYLEHARLELAKSYDSSTVE